MPETDSDQAAAHQRDRNRAYYQANRDKKLAYHRARRADIRKPVVYIHRDSSGAVIYVGRGNKERVGRSRSWQGEIARVLVRRCQTWADSLVLEALLIRKYQPKHNRIGVTR